MKGKLFELQMKDHVHLGLNISSSVSIFVSVLMAEYCSSNLSIIY